MSSEEPNLTKIRNHALRLLSRRSYSQLQLEQKLLRHYSEKEVMTLLEELIERRLLDDASLAEERALMLRSRRHWGTQRIKGDLRRLGFDAKMVARATDRAESAFPSEETLARVIQVWTRKNGEPGSVARLKKLFDHCRRQGFPSQMVRDLLEPFWGRLDG